MPIWPPVARTTRTLVRRHQPPIAKFACPTGRPQGAHGRRDVVCPSAGQVIVSVVYRTCAVGSPATSNGYEDGALSASRTRNEEVTLVQTTDTGAGRRCWPPTRQSRASPTFHSTRQARQAKDQARTQPHRHDRSRLTSRSVCLASPDQDVSRREMNDNSNTPGSLPIPEGLRHSFRSEVRNYGMKGLRTYSPDFPAGRKGKSGSYDERKRPTPWDSCLMAPALRSHPAMGCPPRRDKITISPRTKARDASICGELPGGTAGPAICCAATARPRSRWRSCSGKFRISGASARRPAPHPCHSGGSAA